MNKPRLGLLLAVALSLLGCQSEPTGPYSGPNSSTQASDAPAIDRLRAGNQRYVAGRLQHPRQDPQRRGQLAKGQQPFAVILGCADSRTSPEVLFDQGLGDLFVVRVAGNVLNDEGVASIEYAVEHLGSKLIVVVGHQSCGAVKATKELAAAGSPAPGHLGSLVEAIRPAVQATSGKDLDAAIKMNVRLVVQALRSSAPVLKAKVDTGELTVIGAYYSLDTGAVEFLE